MQYTGSKYDGDYNELGKPHGSGNYELPTGSLYSGKFKDGEFHGLGILYFKSGTQYQSVWHKGRCESGKVSFTDGLQWKPTPWKYCTLEDRRFFSEIVNGLNPGGKSQLTDAEIPPAIPEGHYDTGDGFYNPKSRIVKSYDGIFLRVADEDEHEWITAKCRKGWDEVVGHKID